MRKNKSLITVILILVVLLLGGSSIYIAYRMSTSQQVVPTAPESKPKAVETTAPLEVSCASVSGIPISAARPSYCDTTKPMTIDKTTLRPGESVTVTINSNTDVNTFSALVKDADSTSVHGACYGSAAVSTACPNGGTEAAYSATDKTTMRKSGTVTMTYEQIFGLNKTTNKQVTKVNINGYLRIDNGLTSLYNNACYVGLEVGLPSDVTAEKFAYKDNANNKAGDYTLTSKITTVAKNQMFVYSFKLTNAGAGNASGVAITDTLKGSGLDSLSVVDFDSKCNWNADTRVMSCKTDVPAKDSVNVSFRVKTSDGLANGDEIVNSGKIERAGQSATAAEVNLTANTVVGCNNTCTDDSQCSSGFVCDTDSSKCRNTNCLTATSCICPTAVVTRTPVVTAAATATPIPTETITPITVAEVTTTPKATATPTVLPETGIFDFPGAALFGGGLLMTVIGLLLAL